MPKYSVTYELRGENSTTTDTVTIETLHEVNGSANQYRELYFKLFGIPDEVRGRPVPDRVEEMLDKGYKIDTFEEIKEL